MTDPATRASLMLKRAESAEQALRALREAVRETIGQLQWSLPVGSFDELAKALAESEEKA